MAREALLWTFIEYYQAKFGKAPLLKSINYIAYIISWNLWQMDGLKGIVPDSCRNGVTEKIQTLFGEEEQVVHCTGCQQEAIDKTRKRFKKGNQMLWNAKMRFGKTLSALQVVKEEESAESARHFSYPPSRQLVRACAHYYYGSRVLVPL